MQEPEIKAFETIIYVKEPVEILDQKVKQLRNKEIPIVKVKWSHHSPKEEIWEVEETMRQKYPYLFFQSVSSKF